MRDRLALGVAAAFALLVAISSLGFRPSPHSRLEQVPPSPTPTQVVISTPTSTPAPPTSTSAPPTSTSAPPTSTSTVIATGVPPQPTGTPGAPPRPPGPPATPSLGIRVNACARVVGAQGLILGDAPGFNANHVQTVGRDDVVLVTAGPERADGLWWWRVATRTGVVGWGSNDQLLPQAGACFGLTTATALPTPSPTAKAGITATPGGQAGSLPSTGTNAAGLATAGILILVLVVVGVIRRRTQSAT